MKIMDAIEDGQLDDRLDALIKAAMDRRQLVRQRKARELDEQLEEGDRVIITQGIKPKYLMGRQGVIVPTPPNGKTRDGYRWVNMDQPTQRFGKVVLCPLTCVRKVTA